MSAHEYNLIYHAKLTDLKHQPADLLGRFLASRSPFVRQFILKALTHTTN